MQRDLATWQCCSGRGRRAALGTRRRAAEKEIWPPRSAAVAAPGGLPLEQGGMHGRSQGPRARPCLGPCAARVKGACSGRWLLEKTDGLLRVLGILRKLAEDGQPSRCCMGSGVKHAAVTSAALLPAPRGMPRCGAVRAVRLHRVAPPIGERVFVREEVVEPSHAPQFRCAHLLPHLPPQRRARRSGRRAPHAVQATSSSNPLSSSDPSIRSDPTRSPVHHTRATSPWPLIER